MRACTHASGETKAKNEGTKTRDNKGKKSLFGITTDNEDRQGRSKTVDRTATTVNSERDLEAAYFITDAKVIENPVYDHYLQSLFHCYREAVMEQGKQTIYNTLLASVGRYTDVVGAHLPFPSRSTSPLSFEEIPRSSINV